MDTHIAATLEAHDVPNDGIARVVPSGRVELFSRDLEDRFGYGLPRYELVKRGFPFTIISPSSPSRINATFGHFALVDRDHLRIEGGSENLSTPIRDVSDAGCGADRSLGLGRMRLPEDTLS